MNALIHVVGHTNESYKADHLGWEDVISGARELLTLRALRGLRPYAMMLMMP
jgi:hypothetical protein